MFEAKIEVSAIFVGKGGDGERNPGKVDALMLAELAAIDDFALHVPAADADDTQLDQAIHEQNACCRA